MNLRRSHNIILSFPNPVSLCEDGKVLPSGLVALSRPDAASIACSMPSDCASAHAHPGRDWRAPLPRLRRDWLRRTHRMHRSRCLIAHREA